jgi:hypothetical protein
MFIETEGTPNPATLKFLPGQDVMGFSTADFASPDSAGRSPLATALFALPGVARVFLGGDFITVTKTDEIAWQSLKPQVLGAIMEHFVAGHRDGIVRLHMQGACSGCPSSSATLKHGIENMLKHYVPEVTAVEQVMY